MKSIIVTAILLLATLSNASTKYSFSYVQEDGQRWLQSIWEDVENSGGYNGAMAFYDAMKGSSEEKIIISDVIRAQCKFIGIDNNEKKHSICTLKFNDSNIKNKGAYSVFRLTSNSNQNAFFDSMKSKVYAQIGNPQPDGSGGAIMSIGLDPGGVFFQVGNDLIK